MKRNKREQGGMPKKVRGASAASQTTFGTLSTFRTLITENGVQNGDTRIPNTQEIELDTDDD